MTRVVPGSGSAAISGAMLAGGRITPPLLSSFSLRDSLDPPMAPVRNASSGGGYPSRQKMSACMYELCFKNGAIRLFRPMANIAEQLR